MIDSEVEAEIRKQVPLKINTAIESLRYSSVGGGSINETYRLHVNNKASFFCKINSLSRFPFLFESEKQDMIQYYLDILEDAAEFEIMVYFSTSPRRVICLNSFGVVLAVLLENGLNN